jgi:hypothetical protein
MFIGNIKRHHTKELATLSVKTFNDDFEKGIVDDVNASCVDDGLIDWVDDDIIIENDDVVG